MSSVNSTYDLYQTLGTFNIPIIIPEEYRARNISDIIGDMLRCWRKCDDLSKGRKLVDGLEFILARQEKTGEIYFEPAQIMAFLAVKDEQTDLETAAAIDGSSTDLDAYLDSFKITRG